MAQTNPSIATKQYAIIVAGGSGNRFNAQLINATTAVPKQFLLLDGKPILMHTIEKFYAYNKHLDIIVVLPESQIGYWKDQCKKYNFSVEHHIVKGGATRTESVINGLSIVEDGAIVAIHDGVRPLLTEELISKLFTAALQHDCAIPTLPSTDTLRHITGKLLDRNSILSVQTPQVFNSTKLKSAYSNINPSDIYTDDASVYEAAGNKLYFIEGERANIKITTPFDLALAEMFMKFTAI